MSPLPEQMADRWSGRPMLPAGQGRLYWHVLLGDHPGVRAQASEARKRLVGLPGLDLVPHEWLHLTVLVAGLTEKITASQVDAMVAEAGRLLARVRPITVTLEQLLYHPEAIVLAARPAHALDPLLDAVRTATRVATGRDGVLAHEPWTPHVTLAYSSAVQPAAPVIATLGRELPACDVNVRSVSLVNQDGPEYVWDWRPMAEIPLGAAIVSDA